VSETPPPSLLVNHLEDRWRGELWPAPDPTALKGAFAFFVATVALLGGLTTGWLPMGAAAGTAFVTLLGTVYFVTQLVRIPVPFEVAPTSLSINDDQVMWSQVNSVHLDPDIPTLTVGLDNREPLVLAADPEWHSRDDLAWLADRIAERVG
jgi:hypothetical protein